MGIDYDSKVECIEYNWCYSNEIGQESSNYEVGKYGVKEIEYHQPAGEGDRHYCDVIFENGYERRIFNLNAITYKK